VTEFVVEPFSYVNGQPDVKAQLRSAPEDFRVVEDLGYEPEGEGEHHYLYIQKRGENTDWVARQLANFCQVSPRDVAYAGKKDRHAVTEQWFSVHLPGSRRVLNWALFGGDTINVLKSSKHRRKIKLGHLKGNRFEITLREVSDVNRLLHKATSLESGVPNYFGEQRFGQSFGNLHSGLAILSGELVERQRNKRSMYISALRSYLFNRVISTRIDQGTWDSPLDGDVLIEDFTQKVHRYDANDPDQKARFDQCDLHLTAPMWGKGELYSLDKAQMIEKSVVAGYPQISEGLETLGLRQERRSMRLVPRDLHVEVLEEQVVKLSFSLPSGSFATSVLRELCVW
jgi:tRNA pseudouridine13 synthase